jgi:hypothetical protein
MAAAAMTVTILQRISIGFLKKNQRFDSFLASAQQQTSLRGIERVPWRYKAIKWPFFVDFFASTKCEPSRLKRMEGESSDEMVNDVRLFVKGNEFVLYEEPLEGEAEVVKSIFSQ